MSFIALPTKGQAENLALQDLSGRLLRGIQQG